MASTRVCTPLLGILLCLLSSTSRAQPIGTHRDSLQWMTAGADVIVRGRVKSVMSIGKPEMGYCQVTVHTLETLAGHAQERICFVSSRESPYQELKEVGHPALFFLVSSRSDFTRHARFYLYTRCPWICGHVIDLDRPSPSIPSFDEMGLRELQDSATILANVRQFLATHQSRERIKSFTIREPNQKAFTGYDARVTVPLDQHVYQIAKIWSAAGGIKARVGREIQNKSSPLVPFDAAKIQHANKPQLPTDWHHANSLNIDSLEWMTSDSDAIVLGTINDLVMVQKGDYESQENYDATLDIHLLRFQVDETLKGAVNEEIAVEISNGGRLGQWRSTKTPLVLFLKDRSMLIKEAPRRLGVTYDYRDPPTVRYSGRGPDTKAVIALDDGEEHPRVFSARDGWLTEPSKMLGTVRSYLEREHSAHFARSPEHSRMVSLKPPASFLRETPWENDPHVRIRFPIDGYLEHQAQRWLKSDQKERRWMGAYCLVYFKSDENAEALRAVLHDPGRWPQPVNDVIYTKEKVTYLVRREAWTILDAWGYDDAKPSFSDEGECGEFLSRG